MLSIKDEQAEHGPIKKFTLKRLFGLGYVIYDDSIKRPFNEPSVIVNIFYHKKLRNLHEKTMIMMLEWPEVEAINRALEPQIQGLTIENVTAKRTEVIAHPNEDEFC